jgi:glycosyltransferase involved in cell wall biosynthesis
VSNSVGAVVIGRNEGGRLLACLQSVLRSDVPAVYVDSGSTDGSVAAARALGVDTIELDLSTPFTAARARNAGFERLSKLFPHVQYVQFVDGDCELMPGWFERAAAELDARPDTAVVFGRCRERHPEASVYNRLCDIEWDRPVGESKTCGGIALVRAGAFREAGRYDPALIAGEEPEMCVRLRQRGWHIHRIDAEMTWHDADMTRFRQWWRRMVRSGHAYAEVSQMHRDTPQRIWAKESRSIWVWGLGVPAAFLLAGVVAFALGLPVWPVPVAFVALHAVQFARIFRRQRGRGMAARHAAAYTLAVLVGKYAQVIGQAKFWAHKLRGTPNTIIEYKSPAPVAPPAPRAAAPPRAA